MSGTGGAGGVHTRRRNVRGFTLIEVLLVLLVLGLLAAAVGVGLSGSLASARAQESVRDLVSHMRYAHGRATVEQRARRVILDLEERRYRLDGETWQALAEGMAVELRTAAQEVVSEDRAAIRFLPGGGSTGGRVLLRHEGRVWTITVSWLTGFVEWHEGIAGDDGD